MTPDEPFVPLSRLRREHIMRTHECADCGRRYPSQTAADRCCEDGNETFGDEPWWRSIN